MISGLANMKDELNDKIYLEKEKLITPKMKKELVKYIDQINQNDLANFLKKIMNFIKKTTKNTECLLYLENVNDVNSKNKIDKILKIILKKKTWENETGMIDKYFYRENLFILNLKEKSFKIPFVDILIFIYLTREFLEHYFSCETLKKIEEDNLTKKEFMNSEFIFNDFSYFLKIHRFLQRLKKGNSDLTKILKKYQVFEYVQKQVSFPILKNFAENEKIELSHLSILKQDQITSKIDKKLLKKYKNCENREELLETFKKSKNSKNEEESINYFSDSLFLDVDLIEKIIKRIKQFIRLYTTQTIKGSQILDVFHPLYITKRISNMKLKQITGKVVKKLLLSLKEEFILLNLKNNLKDIDFESDLLKHEINQSFENKATDDKKISLKNDIQYKMFRVFVKNIEKKLICFNFEKSLFIEGILNSIKISENISCLVNTFPLYKNINPDVEDNYENIFQFKIMIFKIEESNKMLKIYSVKNMEIKKSIEIEIKENLEEEQNFFIDKNKFFSNINDFEPDAFLIISNSFFAYQINSYINKYIYEIKLNKNQQKSPCLIIHNDYLIQSFLNQEKSENENELILFFAFLLYDPKIAFIRGFSNEFLNQIFKMEVFSNKNFDLDFVNFLVMEKIKKCFFDFGIPFAFLKNTFYFSCLKKLFNFDLEYDSFIKKTDSINKNLSNELLEDIQIKNKSFENNIKNQMWNIFEVKNFDTLISILLVNKKNIINTDNFKFQKKDMLIVEKLKESFCLNRDNNLLLKAIDSKIYKLFNDENLTKCFDDFFRNFEKEELPKAIDVAKIFIKNQNEEMNKNLKKYHNKEYREFTIYKINLINKIKNIPKIKVGKIVEMEIISVDQNMMRGKIEKYYSGLIIKKDSDLEFKKNIEFKNYFSKNEKIKGVIMNFQPNLLRVDISLKDEDINNYQLFLRKNSLFQKYSIKENLNFKVLESYDFKPLKRSIKFRNFDFIKFEHQKFLNEGSSEVRKKLKIKDEDDYFFIPAKHQQSNFLNIEIYFAKKKEFLRVSVFYKSINHLQEEKIISIENECSSPSMKFFFINKESNFIKFNDFIDYFQKVFKNLKTLVESENYSVCSFQKNLANFEKSELLFFKTKNSLQFKICFLKNKLILEKFFSVGTYFEIDDLKFENFDSFSTFVKFNFQKDSFGASKIFDTQNLITISEDEQNENNSKQNDYRNKKFKNDFNYNSKNKENYFQKHNNDFRSQNIEEKNNNSDNNFYTTKENNTSSWGNNKNQENNISSWGNNNNQENNTSSWGDNDNQDKKENNISSWGDNNNQENNASPWGDNDNQENNTSSWGDNDNQENNTSSWGDNDNQDKKENNISSWGNNDNQENNTSSWGNNKNQENNISSWGDNDNQDKKENNISSWGDNNNQENNNTSSWGNNKNQENNISSWGDNDIQENNASPWESNDNQENNASSWGNSKNQENNNTSSWGNNNDLDNQNNNGKSWKYNNKNVNTSENNYLRNDQVKKDNTNSNSWGNKNYNNKFENNRNYQKDINNGNNNNRFENKEKNPYNRNKCGWNKQNNDNLKNECNTQRNNTRENKIWKNKNQINNDNNRDWKNQRNNDNNNEENQTWKKNNNQTNEKQNNWNKNEENQTWKKNNNQSDEKQNNWNKNEENQTWKKNNNQTNEKQNNWNKNEENQTWKKNNNQTNEKQNNWNKNEDNQSWRKNNNQSDEKQNNWNKNEENQSWKKNNNQTNEKQNNWNKNEENQTWRKNNNQSNEKQNNWNKNEDNQTWRKNNNQSDEKQNNWNKNEENQSWRKNNNQTNDKQNNWNKNEDNQSWRKNNNQSNEKQNNWNKNEENNEKSYNNTKRHFNLNENDPRNKFEKNNWNNKQNENKGNWKNQNCNNNYQYQNVNKNNQKEYNFYNNQQKNNQEDKIERGIKKIKKETFSR